MLKILHRKCLKHVPTLYETLDTGFATRWHYAIDVTQYSKCLMYVPSVYETLDAGFATKRHYAKDITQKVPNARTPSPYEPYTQDLPQSGTMHIDITQ